MFVSSPRTQTVLLLLFSTILHSGDGIQCYECVDRLELDETSACLSGDKSKLSKIYCTGSSVCIVFHYQTIYSGTLTNNNIKRGCHNWRDGPACKVMNRELKMNPRNKNTVHYTCNTCSTDFCNGGGVNGANGINTVPLVLKLIVGIMCWFVLL